MESRAWVEEGGKESGWMAAGGLDEGLLLACLGRAMGDDIHNCLLQEGGDAPTGVSYPSHPSQTSG